jgi:ABC-type uncharacterized transport system auxiliary subunit
MGATASELPFGKAENLPRFDSPLSQDGQPIQTMKKLICILASAALLGACEQKTDVVAPASSPAPAEKKNEHTTTVVNPPAVEKKETTTNNTTVVSTPPTNSSTTTTTTTSSPSP